VQRKATDVPLLRAFVAALALLDDAAARGAEPPPTDDAAWLRERGTLLFEDDFEREEEGNLAAALGAGWTSATADRVPSVKQADLDAGVLKVTVDPRAGHGAHLHHEAGFADGGAILRFRLPGISRGESLNVGFVDRETSPSRAGHLCYAIVDGRTIRLLDRKTGYSDPEIAKRRDPYLARREPLPPDLEALLATKMRDVAWPGDHEWHELVVATEGDEMRVSLDGRLLGRHRSAGFAHPVKRWFSLGIGTTAWVDDVRVYRVR